MALDNHSKVLIISRNFPPLVGGMERLILNAYQQLQIAYRCDVIAPHGNQAHLQPTSRSVGCPVNPVPVFLLCAFVKGLLAHIRGGYQLYFAGSGVTAPLAVIFAKLFRKPSVVYLHGLDIIADNWVYQHVFVPFFRYADTVIVNSHNTAQLARQHGIAAERIEIIHPGVEIPQAPPSSADFRQRHGLKGSKLLLSVGRIIPRKGLAEFVTQAFAEIVHQQPACQLLVIGAEAQQALKKSQGSQAALEQAIDAAGLREHVILLGYVDDAELAAAYAAADAFIFPLRPMPDDVEGFGMVAVEAAAHGLPTIAFAVGGVADAIAEGISGSLVASGDYPAFAAKVVATLNHPDRETLRANCIKHAQRFSWPLFGERLRQRFSAILTA